MLVEGVSVFKAVCLCVFPNVFVCTKVCGSDQVCFNTIFSEDTHYEGMACQFAVLWQPSLHDDVVA